MKNLSLNFARRLLPLLAVAATALSAPPAWSLGDGYRGRETAERWCSSCHIVAEPASRTAIDAAPPFAAIARDPQMTPAIVRTFLNAPHPPMPDFQLSNADIDDLVAYFELLGLD